ncbi:hypothetical protein CHS0354_012754 [Potamilus streckersoni]|uniref:Uncharacterized protein n=1 Tax=Potamilus streckersoni TaxID=2493646 RepID=A0AAE0RV74_9BIVA|nr:hypothetical protein CHS0354_012754 [Potamilus streckersoni]
MEKRPWQFNLGPDYKITPYQYKPYKPNNISNKFREYKKVHLWDRVVEKIKPKTKMGPDIPVREYKYVPTKPNFIGIYGEKPRTEKSTQKQIKSEKPLTPITTKPVQEIVDKTQKRPVVPPLNLREFETPDSLPKYTEEVEHYGIYFGYYDREFTERVVISSPAPEYESSEEWLRDSPTMDRSYIRTPIGSPPTSLVPSLSIPPLSLNTNIVPALAFRHTPPHQSYGLPHHNLVRGTFRAETPVLKGRSPKIFPSNADAINQYTKARK